MPNCDFYAVPDDHREVLLWLFAERSCSFYELASELEKPLRQFHSADEVLDEFERVRRNGSRWTSVHLQLEVVDAGPSLKPRRVALNPHACDGATFRYAAEGWGLVQLYLSAPTESGLDSSHTNHNSRRRAEVWASTSSLADDPKEWDFERIESFSRKLNRQIRRRGVAKIGSRVVLPGALRVWEAGVPLWPYRPGGISLVYGKKA